jgi:hypothetical protein
MEEGSSTGILSVGLGDSVDRASLSKGYVEVASGNSFTGDHG